jgi:hypothetical protein
MQEAVMDATRRRALRRAPLRQEVAAYGAEAADTRPAVLRPGWLGRLLRAVSLPGGIPPGRARPKPPGALRDREDPAG